MVETENGARSVQIEYLHASDQKNGHGAKKLVSPDSKIQKKGSHSHLGIPFHVNFSKGLLDQRHRTAETMSGGAQLIDVGARTEIRRIKGRRILTGSQMLVHKRGHLSAK